MKEKYYIYVSELLKGVKPCEYCEELENSCKDSTEEVEQYIKDLKILYDYLLNNDNYINIQIFKNDEFLKEVKIFKE